MTTFIAATVFVLMAVFGTLVQRSHKFEAGALSVVRSFVVSPLFAITLFVSLCVALSPLAQLLAAQHIL